MHNVQIYGGIRVKVQNGRMIMIVNMKNEAMVLDLTVAVGDMMMIMTTNEEEAG